MPVITSSERDCKFKDVWKFECTKKPTCYSGCIKCSGIGQENAEQVV